MNLLRFLCQGADPLFFRRGSARELRVRIQSPNSAVILCSFLGFVKEIIEEIKTERSDFRKADEESEEK